MASLKGEPMREMATLRTTVGRGMHKVLILGATGSIARHAIDLFRNETDAEPTL